MITNKSKDLQDGDQCIVVGETHVGKLVIVQDFKLARQVILL